MTEYVVQARLPDALVDESKVEQLRSRYVEIARYATEDPYWEINVVGYSGDNAAIEAKALRILGELQGLDHPVEMRFERYNGKEYILDD